MHSVLCERRINECLVSGYSRENCKSTLFIPSSVLDIISYYYPSMNGHTFIWKLKNNHDLMSSPSNAIDSDVFDIGLSNKFFLRLKANIINGKETTNRYNVDSDVEDAETNNLTLCLMSFPLSTSHSYQIIHCELYFHEINAQYSTIWKYSNSNSMTINRYPMNHINMNSMNMNPMMQSNPNTMQYNNLRADTYIEFKWIINYDLDNYSLNELTFECKMNVLQIMFNPTENIKPYNYAALPKLNGNNKMKFVWNIVDAAIIDQLIDYKQCNYDFKDVGDVQFHSDIFYDMFQLQIGRKYDNYIHNNYFQIQICGLPKNTDKMGVKLQLFAIPINNEKSSMQIMSNIVTFSYNFPEYKLSNNKTNLLMDLLSQYKNMSILCVANIIHKYDENSNAVKDEINLSNKSNEKTNNKSKYIDYPDKETKTLTLSNTNHVDEENKYDDFWINDDSKILKYRTDSFVWNIRDKILLNKIKTKTDVFYNSKIIELLGRKWYITIHAHKKPNNSNFIVLIVLNCILHTGSIDCMVTIKLLQTNYEKTYYERFGCIWSGGYLERMNSQKNGYTRCLQVTPSNIETLNQLSIKVTIGIINDYFQDEQEDDEHDNEVKVWLSDIVGLPQYYQLFIKQGIDRLSVIKLLLSEDDNSWSKEIKFGHRLRIIDEIRKLTKQNNSNTSVMIKKYCILVISICILSLCLLYRLY